MNLSGHFAYQLGADEDFLDDGGKYGMLVKVVAVQSRLGQKLTLEEQLLIFKQRPDFTCLPEYSFIDESTPDFAHAAYPIDENLKYLRDLSEAFATCLIGGSVVEAEGDFLHNSSYVFNRGQFLGKYRKLNPVAGELKKGIIPGDGIFTTEVDAVKIGIMICADALNTNLFQTIAKDEVDIIFIPTTSPYRPDERTAEKFRRDNDIYVRASQISSSYIVKTCAVGSLFGRPLQGRSLIASPWGILRRVEPHAELSRRILTAVLDVDEIRDFRSKKYLCEQKKDTPKSVP